MSTLFLITFIISIIYLIYKVEIDITQKFKVLDDKDEIIGPKGDIGPQGPRGPMGPRGLIGPKGDKGNVGPKGDKGEMGLTGLQGLPGPRGFEGPIGEIGLQGIQGPIGPRGEKGDMGPVGPMGKTGLQGIPGEIGPQGLKGDVGPKGDKGDIGLQGIQGERGDMGPRGETGIQGLKGDIGLTGPQGEKGDKGNTGDTGPRGHKGEKGEKGDTGDRGEQGPKGEQGKVGPRGIQGEKGDKGDRGDFANEVDFILGKNKRGDTGASRAIVKVDGGKLVINYNNDFNQVEINSNKNPLRILGKVDVINELTALNHINVENNNKDWGGVVRLKSGKKGDGYIDFLDKNGKRMSYFQGKDYGAYLDGRIHAKNGIEGIGSWHKKGQTVYGGKWGNWKGMKHCPKDHYVCGLEVRFEDDQGGGDDTAMNGLKMDCCRFYD